MQKSVKFKLEMFSTKFDEKAKLWSGADDVPLYNPKISVGQVVLGILKIHGPKTAQISDNNGIQLTFDEIRMKTIRTAQNLQKRGYEPRQVIALMAKNSHHVAPIVFASMSIGCTVNALGLWFPKSEIINIFKTTKPALIFCDVDYYELAKECLNEVGNDAKIFTFGGSKGEAEPVDVLFAETHDEENFLPVRVDGENEAAVIICSSGTTARSKLVCLSHASLLDILTHVNICTSNDVIQCFSPLYFISGIRFLIIGTLSGATRIITTEFFTPELQFRLIEKYKVTFTYNSAPHYVSMMKCDHIPKYDLSSMKFAWVSGSTVPFHVKTEIAKYLPNGSVNVGFGLSETVGVVSMDYPTSGRDTVGRLINGIHAKIIDDNGNRCGVNVDGEVCFKTNYKFLGYYKNQKATNKIFDSEEFFMTGDIGHFDEDGYLYVIDRKKGLIKYYGKHISPSEIFSCLIQSSDIISACVVGIPDEMATELPAAVLVRANGSNITEKEVFDLVANHFPDHCKLRGGVYFVDSLPTTPTGKVVSRKAKEIAISLFKAHKI